MALVAWAGAAVGSVLAQGAAGAVVKQRAKEVVDQHNVRQGVPSPASSVVAPQGAGSGQVRMASEMVEARIRRIQTALGGLVGAGATDARKKEALVTSLIEACAGPRKPAAGAVRELAESLAGCLGSATVEAEELRRLATNLYAVMNAGSLPQDKVQSILSDVQAVLQVAGVRRAQAVGVTGQLRGIVRALQGPDAP